jgi:acyl-CoA synthetase (AMP-forming)/AMP-acid ligase II
LATGWLKLGVRKDDVLMVQLPNVLELVAVYLAAARLGVVVTPLPMQYRQHELRQVLELTEPKFFVTVSSFDGVDYLHQIAEVRPHFPRLQGVVGLGDSLPNGVIGLAELLATARDGSALETYLADPTSRVTANDILTICWTSGTEAEPKGVPRSHNHWIWIAYATVDGCELDVDCSLLNPFPLINMAGIGGMLVPWLLTGGKLALHHPLDLAVFLQQIVDEQVNYTVVPPALLNMLLMKPQILERADFSSIKNIGSGSAPLSPWMVEQWQERFGIHVINMFGSNEGIALTSGPKEFPAPQDRARYFPRFGVPGYEWSSRIAAQMRTKLVEPGTRQVIDQPGVAGELAVRSPGVFAGYYRRPDLTRGQGGHQPRGPQDLAGGAGGAAGRSSVRRRGGVHRLSRRAPGREGLCCRGAPRGLQPHAAGDCRLPEGEEDRRLQATREAGRRGCPAPQPGGQGPQARARRAGRLNGLWPERGA